MTVYILRRLTQTLLVLGVTSALVFGGLYLVGDPVEILVNPNADQIEKERTAKALGLDKPVLEQYAIFLKGAATGNLGTSFVFGRPAMEVILERMPATLELAFLAMLISVCLGIPLGLYAGLRPHSRASKAIMAGSILGFSLPTFWVGLLLILVFAVQLGWLPSTGRGPTQEILGIQVSILHWEGLKYALLPAINLALFKLSLIIRLTRAQVREQSLLDYIKFARAKGLPRVRVVGVHLLKNILIPLVTVIGLELGSVIAFAIVTETIFAWPGMGKLVIDSIFQLDRPVVVAYLLVTVFMFILINLVVDILYSVLDPRVRLAEAKG
jgi:peptide/nickel transport system permease protein